MKNAYSRPTIVKLGSPLYAKHGAVSQGSLPIRESIDGVKVSSLCEQFGSPLFVFSEETIRKTYRRIHAAFSSRYENVKFGWSYKTNYLKAICAILHQEGAVAEVVSDFEYEKARGLGIPGDQIIFNGPCKPAKSLKQAVLEGAQIHLDSIDEMTLLDSIAKSVGKKARVGLRVNMNTGTHPQWSRFGFNLETGQAMDALKRAKKCEHLEILGLHCHIGTFMLNSNAYQMAAEKMCKLFNDAEEELGIKFEFLDLGGGFPSANRLKGVYQAPEISVPAIEEYAELMTNALNQAFPPGRRPLLILEAGRYLVDEAGYLITSVISRKLMPDGVRSYVLDAGVNFLYTSTWYRFQIALEQKTEGFHEASVLYGPLCMNIDIVDEGLMLPPLKPGQRLIFSPVGAYNVTQWMQFIQYRPAVVLVRSDRTVEIIRKREDLAAVELSEVLPADLQLEEHPANVRYLRSV